MRYYYFYSIDQEIKVQTTLSDLPKVTQYDREERKLNLRTWGTMLWLVGSVPSWPHEVGSPWSGGKAPPSCLLQGL